MTPNQKEALEAIARGGIYPAFEKEHDGWHARWRIVGGVENDWVDDYVRSAVVTPLCRDAERQSHPTLHDAWMAALKSETGLVVWDEGECAAFAGELRRWHRGVAAGDERASLVFSFSASKKSFSLSCRVPHGAGEYRSLGEASFVAGILRSLRRKGGRLVAQLTQEEAEIFLSSTAGELAAAGYRVEGCDLSAGIVCQGEIKGAEKPGNGNELKLVVRVDGKAVTADEIKFLLDQGSSLVFFRDHWIEVDRNILRSAYRALEKSDGKKLSRSDALRFAFGFGRVSGIEVETLAARGWLKGFVGAMRNAGRSASAPVIEGFRGDLREYQLRAVSWMSFLTENGFGALLADDMGLGKTVEAIAWMKSVRERPFLVVAPLTLLSNWKHEIARFAPGMKTLVHHGSSRLPALAMRTRMQHLDVVITSYSLLVRDFESFSSVKWAGVVLDEAQAVKNPDTRVSSAARNLDARRRVALTGTPVENSPLDIWGLEEFLNPGFLGTRREFERRFVKTALAGGGFDKLRGNLEPFVLRRLKSDPGIAAELGEKHVIREYCRLSAAEKREYEDTLESYRNGARERGDAFSLITRLKLVCDGEGKLARLFELLDEIFAAGESALVFSQYVRIGDWITGELEKRFGRKFEFLNGSLPPAERERRISRFMSSPRPDAFVLSLKAGGYGLNLTKATHVIHFDRWWNPAVENQATDRAHRIGQKKTVFVHCFITAGTIEEHVDDILVSKSAVSAGLITSGESYLMKLEDDELIRISELR